MMMKKLNILHISCFQRGGAGIAAMRLHNGLLEQGVESHFLFLKKGIKTQNTHKFKREYYFLDLLLRILKKLGFPLTLEHSNDYKLKNYRKKFEIFSFANTSFTYLHNHPLVKECDVIHLHWVANFIDYTSFFYSIDKPIVWTLHDMNPFQGGFHYELDAKKFSNVLNGLDRVQFTIKKQALGLLPNTAITIITPSLWLKEKSEQSEILGRFKHKHISYGIDTKIYKINDCNNHKIKSIENTSKLIVLFVAENLNNPRKGFDMIMDLIKDESIHRYCQFVAAGEYKKSQKMSGVIYLGKVKNELEMSLLYCKANIFLLPSLEDNLPNTMIESLCCGTPIVGFKIGGLKEIIRNGDNGFLSAEISSSGLKNVLLDCINNINNLNRNDISKNAHAKFSYEMQSKAYLQVYTSLTAS